MVSGSPDVSNSFVSPCSDSFVSQSGWWSSGSLDVSNLFVSPPSSNSFVSQSGWWCGLSGCLSSLVSPSINSFVSQSGWWCLAGGVWLVLSGSPLVCVHLSPFIGLPVWLVGEGLKKHFSGSRKKIRIKKKIRINKKWSKNNSN